MSSRGGNILVDVAFDPPWSSQTFTATDQLLSVYTGTRAHDFASFLTHSPPPPRALRFAVSNAAVRLENNTRIIITFLFSYPLIIVFCFDCAPVRIQLRRRICQRYQKAMGTRTSGHFRRTSDATKAVRFWHELRIMSRPGCRIQVRRSRFRSAIAIFFRNGFSF